MRRHDHHHGNRRRILGISGTRVLLGAMVSALALLSLLRTRSFPRTEDSVSLRESYDRRSHTDAALVGSSRRPAGIARFIPPPRVDIDTGTKGLVLCLHGGGASDVAMAGSLIREIRCLGNDETIELYHCAGLREGQQRFLRRLDHHLEIIDACAGLVAGRIFPETLARAFAGDWLRPLALYQTHLQEPIVMDVGTLLLQDSALARATKMYKTTGTMFFRDRVVPLLDDNTNAPLRTSDWYGIVGLTQLNITSAGPVPSDTMRKSARYRGLSRFEQDPTFLAVDKGRPGAPAAMKVLWFLITAHRFTVDFSVGDREAMWLAFELAQASYTFSPWGAAVLSSNDDATRCGSLGQFMPDGDIKDDNDQREALLYLHGRTLLDPSGTTASAAAVEGDLINAAAPYNAVPAFMRRRQPHALGSHSDADGQCAIAAEDRLATPRRLRNHLWRRRLHFMAVTLGSGGPWPTATWAGRSWGSSDSSSPPSQLNTLFPNQTYFCNRLEHFVAIMTYGDLRLLTLERPGYATAAVTDTVTKRCVLFCSLTSITLPSQPLPHAVAAMIAATDAAPPSRAHHHHHPPSTSRNGLLRALGAIMILTTLVSIAQFSFLTTGDNAGANNAANDGPGLLRQGIETEANVHRVEESKPALNVGEEPHTPAQPSTKAPRPRVPEPRTPIRPGSRGILLCLHDGIIPLGVSLIRELRCLGNHEPIEVYHCDELSTTHQALLRDIDTNLQVIDVCARLIESKTMDLEMARSFRSYWIKPLAVHETTLDELILLDADAVLLRDPATLRSIDGYTRTGTIFFYDRVINENIFFNREHPESKVKYLTHWIRHFDYARFGLTAEPSSQLQASFAYRGLSCHEQDSSMLLLHKTATPATPTAMSILWMLITEQRFEYEFSWGDKEAFWLSYEFAHAPYFFSPWGASVVSSTANRDLERHNQTLCGSLAHFVPVTDGPPEVLYVNGKALVDPVPFNVDKLQHLRPNQVFNMLPTHVTPRQQRRAPKDRPEQGQAFIECLTGLGATPAPRGLAKALWRRRVHFLATAMGQREALESCAVGEDQ